MANQETTTNYLVSLAQNRNNLSNILKQKGVNASTGEKLESLVEKVGLIHGGVEYGEWFPISSTDEFTLKGIPFLPAKLGISCESLFTNRIVAPNAVHIALLNTELCEDKTNLYELDANNNAIFSTESGEAEITLTKEYTGKYTVTVSFSNHNAAAENKFLFRGGLEHMWVISSQEWSL